MTTTNEKPTKLNEEEMDMVNGGGWGYDIYRNENEYRAAGFFTD